MKSLIAVMVVALVLAVAGMAQARVLSAGETQHLLETGTIRPLEQLHQAVQDQLPGARIGRGSVEEAYGKYRYKVEVKDEKGVGWALTLDATDAQLIDQVPDAS
ncbi:MULTISPECIES: PepSY domain-containing protein [Pseudomonas]|nr:MULTISPECIES: hypothetical protein [Pseudomonas]NRH29689.1 peptidase [Pseudomonas sp. MS19]OEO25719.1 hypothetical protein AX279_11835 [Pseudomonas sp. J237]